MHIEDTWFKDDEGRRLVLRGANVGGSSKVPYEPDGATWRRDGFFDHRTVSFVGRPFPLVDADEHFARLRRWGLTFLRFLTTWEAVEHAGPGQYDEEYLDYLRAVILKAAAYGIDVFIDPHQDVWSRFTGGDGAPGWTLEAVGMDLEKLHEAGAAFVHAMNGDPYPRMIWPGNYFRLGAATMFTLFFAGDDLAPLTTIEGERVQSYLQRHYINAMRQVALRLRDLDNVVGYGVMNEPGTGFIGISDLSAIPSRLLRPHGHAPTPSQAILAGAGYPQDVAYFISRSGEPEQRSVRTLNPDGISIWRDGYEPVWRTNGVWGEEDGRPVLLRPSHFAVVAGRRVAFARDYLKPFAVRFIEAIRDVHDGAFLFMEGTPGGSFEWGPEDPPGVVHASHWYDTHTLYTKAYHPHVGHDRRKGIVEVDDKRAFFREQLAGYREQALQQMGGIPTLIGEFGAPFDMHGKRSYETGDFTPQIALLDACYHAMDANLLNCTIWNYTADNSNDRGDQWNDEDLSIFSRDQQNDASDLDSGGRALEAVVRPHARATAGEPLTMAFDLPSRTFTFVYRPDPEISAPTIVFVPDYHYSDGFEVELSAGTYSIDPDSQTVAIWHGDTAGEEMTLCIYPTRR